MRPPAYSDNFTKIKGAYTPPSWFEANGILHDPIEFLFLQRLFTSLRDLTFARVMLLELWP